MCETFKRYFDIIVILGSFIFFRVMMDGTDRTSFCASYFIEGNIPSEDTSIIPKVPRQSLEISASSSAIWSGIKGAEHIVEVLRPGPEAVYRKKENKNVLVLFYSPECQYSKKVLPEFASAAELIQELKDDERPILAAVNCLDNKEICRAEKILGYPTINFYKEGSFVEEVPDASGRRADKIVAYITNLNKAWFNFF